MEKRLEILKRQFVWIALAMMLMQFSIARISSAFAYDAGSVVINEIAWAGTTDESNDEWIELYNNTRETIDLSGWSIDDDNGSSIYTIASGEIAPYGYFLIADSEAALKNVSANAVIGLSLANTGDSLVLKNAVGAIVDTVNGSGGAWYAGNNTGKASMERMDPLEKPDSASNWTTATSGNGATGRSGTPVLGTPGSVNSAFSGASVKISLEGNVAQVSGENHLLVSGKISSAVDAYAYGLNLSYDAAKLDFLSANEGAFLKNDQASTTFQYDLENDTEGNLIIGGARLLIPASGVDGSGELFTADFKIIGGATSGFNLNFVQAESFLADIVGDVPVGFVGYTGEGVQQNNVGGVSGLKAELSDSRYAFELSWAAPQSGGADKYVVKRKGKDGTFVTIGEAVNLSFVDNDEVDNGGQIVPNLTYEYQIIPVKNGVTGEMKTITVSENRGVVGDNTRDDRVNGRDLEKLARSYGANSENERYNALADTTYDGIIDGSDLIDIGANFGKSYE